MRGPGHCVTLRYPAEAARAVREFTAAIRGLAEGRPQPVPTPRLGTPGALRRWRPVLDDKACADSDCAAVEMRLPGWWHRRWARHILVGVTPRELLVALAPGAHDTNALVDVVYIPRSRPNQVACADGTLRIDADGVLVDVALAGRRAARARDLLGRAIPDSRADVDESPRTMPDHPPLRP
ncbi:hypothetical protein JL475_36245 [Streptomyces sp. M2CJ-2]|uniref:hypothetical protein n=1 Tax=Streptomyces sp. M2CJ-2 TaxID=2803948 RepID=UPI0019253B0A|nr:hypothetical protein [Streptomyces sp. M2CJ-2]MBL3671273.1 hypothetical protein [Streptomyces sp. M2CJ-2]